MEVERRDQLEHRADGRVAVPVGQQAADDLGLDRDPPRQLGLGESLSRAGALERTDEGVRRVDLRARRLVVLPERGVLELLVEEPVEACLGGHDERNIYATHGAGNPWLHQEDPGCGPAALKTRKPPDIGGFQVEAPGIETY